MFSVLLSTKPKEKSVLSQKSGMQVIPHEMLLVKVRNGMLGIVIFYPFLSV